MASTLVTIVLLLFFYPAGLIVMWVWPKWNIWVKVLVTVVPILLIGLMVLLLPYVNPMIEKELGPLNKCVNSCSTTDLNSSCIRQCNENYLQR